MIYCLVFNKYTKKSYKFCDFFAEKCSKFWRLEKSLYICRPKRNYGLMAEWLGRGLQNLVQRFESASDLTNPFYTTVWRGFLFFTLIFTHILRPCRVAASVSAESNPLFLKSLLVFYSSTGEVLVV